MPARLTSIGIDTRLADEARKVSASAPAPKPSTLRFAKSSRRAASRR